MLGLKSLGLAASKGGVFGSQVNTWFCQKSEPEEILCICFAQQLRKCANSSVVDEAGVTDGRNSFKKQNANKKQPDNVPESKFRL